MSKGRVLKSKQRSEDGRRTAGILEGITVSVTNMKPDRGNIIQKKKMRDCMSVRMSSAVSVARDVTPLQCVCFIVSCMCFDNVQMIHCNTPSLCRLAVASWREQSVLDQLFVCVLYVVFVFFPLTCTLPFTLFTIPLYDIRSRSISATVTVTQCTLSM